MEECRLVLLSKGEHATWGACQLGGASRRGGGNSDGVGLNRLVGGGRAGWNHLVKSGRVLAVDAFSDQEQNTKDANHGENG